MKEIRLAGKKVLFSDSPVLFSYKPDERWLEFLEPKSGTWRYENGAIIGDEPGNRGGILFVKEFFPDDVMLTFTVSAVLPATRDLNAVWAAHWDEDTNYLGESYVCGLNGWWENKAGIERNKSSNLFACTTLYKYTPGSEIKMTCGSIDGHCFMVVDDILVTELVDPSPIKGGHVGFSAYCTRLRITNIEVRKITWEKFRQVYEPEIKE